MDDLIDVFCIGTPEIVGDALGPLVGSMLSKHSLPNINVVGTLDDPVIFSNYYEQTKRLRPGAWVIAVDAVVGEKVNTYTIRPGSIAPGEALKTGLQPIGDMAVKCVTGATILEMSLANKWMISVLAHDITTELVRILQEVQKKVYI